MTGSLGFDMALDDVADHQSCHGMSPHPSPATFEPKGRARPAVDLIRQRGPQFTAQLAAHLGVTSALVHPILHYSVKMRLLKKTPAMHQGRRTVLWALGDGCAPVRAHAHAQPPCQALAPDFSALLGAWSASRTVPRHGEHTLA